MGKKPKFKDIIIEINVKGRRKGVQKSLPPYLFDRLEKVIKREVRTKNDHFKRRGHGWNLSWRTIEEGIYQEVFGNDLSWYVLGRFLQAGDATWGYRKNCLGVEEPMLVKARRMAEKRRKQ